MSERSELMEEVSRQVKEKLDPVVNKLLEAHEKTIEAMNSMEIAFNLIYADPHGWSERSCQTCKAISVMTGIKFGCDRYREVREKQRKST